MTCGNHDQFPNLDWASERIEFRWYISYGILNFDNIGTSLLSVY
jgi:hypothetical protein